MLTAVYIVAAALNCSPVYGAVAVSDGRIVIEGTIESAVKLTAQWQFIPDGSERYKDVNALPDQIFYESISDPDVWKRYFISDKDYNVGWFRTIIVVDKPQDLFLFLPLGKRGSQIFINGHLIRETRPFDDKGFVLPIASKPELVNIHSSNLLKGGNLLAIRTASIDGWGGFMSGLMIGAPEAIKKYWTRYVMLYASFAIVGIFLSSFFFLFFLARKHETFYLSYSGLCMAVSLWTLGFTGLGFYLIDNQLVFNLFTYIGGIICITTALNFLYEYLKINKPVFIKIYTGFYYLMALAVLIEHFATNGLYYYNKYIYDLFINLNAIYVVCAIYINIKAVRMKKPYAYRLLAGHIILVASIVYSSFTFLSFSGQDPIIMEGFFAMTLVFASVLASRFARIHTDLEKAHDELLVIDKMKDEFLTTTSHELRTPLHAISGLVETLEMSPDDPPTERQRESLSIIRRSAARLSRLVDDILDFGKLRAGRVDLFVEEVDIVGLLRGMASLAGSLVDDKPIGIRVETDGGLQQIIGDRHRIEQIVLNMLSNAIKFTDEGEVVLSAHTEGEGVNVSVRDTGCGIAPDELAGILSPFHHLEPADTRRHGGVGLGLSITRHLVEMHGGRISAVSEVGKGSLFTVWLPSNPPEGAIAIRRDSIEPVCPPTMKRAKEEAPGKPGAVPFTRRIDDASEVRVLVVDDDEANRRILVEVLSVRGYEVRTVANGAEAVAAIETSMPHIVLLDIMLPGMSGYELASKIRLTYSGIYIPIIMVTARSGIDDMIKGFAFGGNDYIVKPFNSREVLARVENQLAISNMISMEKRVESFIRKGAGTDEISLVARAAALDEAVRRLSDWEAIISKDLGVAKGFLSRLMRRTVQTGSVEFHIDYDPLYAIGGDVYDVHEYAPGKIRVLLGDATGHGIHASLNTITIMTEYGQLRNEPLSPSAMLAALNERFCSRFSHYRIVFTCCVAEIDLFTGTVRFASAGHPTQFVVLDRLDIARLKPAGPIIGFRKAVQYNELVMDFKPGSVLFLYTDGLLDEGFGMPAAAPGDGRVLRGEEYLRGVLEKLPETLSPAGICAAVKKEMKGDRRKKNRLTDDDITLVALRRK